MKQFDSGVNRAMRALMAFLLSVCVAVFLTATALSLTLLNKGTVRSAMQAENYTAKLADNLLLESRLVFSRAGVMEQMLPSIITEDTVNQSVEYNLTSVMEGGNKQLNKTAEYNALYVQLESDLDAYGILQDSESRANLRTLVDNAQVLFEESATAPMASTLSSFVASFGGVIQIVMFAASILLGAAAAFLLRRLSANNGQFILWLAPALLGAGLALVLPAGWLLLTGWPEKLIDVQRIVVAPVFVRYMNSGLAALLALGAVVLVGTVVFLAVRAMLDKRKMRAAAVGGKQTYVAPEEQEKPPVEAPNTQEGAAAPPADQAPVARPRVTMASPQTHAPAAAPQQPEVPPEEQM